MGKPNFFILGAQRAGTTSLALCLISHSQVAPPVCAEEITGTMDEGIHVTSSDGVYIGKFTGPREFPMPWRAGSLMKECSYFSRFYKVMSLEDYYSFFDNEGNGRISFDASPEYLTMPNVDTRIEDHCPDAKFIVILRDPVKRIWSHYWHEVINNQVETLPFEQAVNRAGYCFCDQYFFSYLSRGCYADHLERWWKIFPRERFLICVMEEFFQDFRHYRDLQKWLGLEPEEITEYPVSTTLPDGYPSMPEKTEKDVRRFYKPRNERLKELLGRELPW